MSAAGAQRVFARLANAWSMDGHRITVLLQDKERESFYPLHPSITLQPLDIAGESRNLVQALRRNAKSLRVLRSSIRSSEPDIVVSFIDNMNISVLLATIGLGIPIIVSERSDPSRREIGKARRLLRRALYPTAACVVVLSQRVYQWFPRSIRARACVIPNPVVIPDGAAGNRGDVPGNGNPKVISVGSLYPVKGHDLLIEAFARLRDRHPQWRLIILGEGPERSALESRIRAWGLTDRVTLPGVTKDVRTQLLHADLFVLPSRVEGFPNALTEAMVSGLPVVVTNCGGAVDEIVRHGEDGIIVPCEDVDALSKAMDLLMSNPDERARLASHASEVLARYSFDHVLGLWDMVISRSVSRGDSRRLEPNTCI